MEEKSMQRMKKKIRENGIDYVLVGDYYIPDLKLPEKKNDRALWQITQSVFTTGEANSLQ